MDKLTVTQLINKFPSFYGTQILLPHSQTLPFHPVLSQLNNSTFSRNKNSSFSLDKMMYIPLKFERSFGETCRLHLHARRMIQARNQCEASNSLSLCLVCVVEAWHADAETFYSSHAYITKHNYLLSISRNINQRYLL
jgi:hypothetical protein